MKDSSIYLVSPPTLYVPPTGAAFCLISNNEEWQNEVTSLIERGIKKLQITFYANNTEYVDPKSWIWFWHVAKNCDLIICDSLNCTQQEFNMSMAMLKLGMPVVFRIKSTNEELQTLFHAIDVLYFETLEDLDNILESFFNG